MTMTRRQLVRTTLAGVGGIALGGALPSVRAQGSPVATPVGTGSGLLIEARELVQHNELPQFLAIMDEKPFLASHIPATIRIAWADLSLEDTSKKAVASWTEHTREMLAVKGLRADQPVVVYDEGTLFAARGWWQLAYLGYPVPMVLDGGLPAWKESRGAIEKGEAGLAPIEAPKVEAGVRRELLATKDEVLASLNDPDVLIVDARSQGEYDKGHIPGAMNREYTSNAIMKDANRYLTPDALRQAYEELGMTSGKRAITYCSTGVRGSVAAFSLRLAGFEDVALYVGSWNEWSRDPNAPVE